VPDPRDESEAPLRLRTLLLFRTLGSGDVLCAPLADRTLVSVGDEEHVALEQRISLPEHLGNAPGEMIARFSFPEGTHLRSPEVVVVRDELPRKLSARVPIAISVALVPASPRNVTRPKPEEARVRFDAWMFILPTFATTWLSVDERFEVEGDEEWIARAADRVIDRAIDERVGSEVRRLWAARDPEPFAWLSLLPLRDRLVPLEIELPRGESLAERRASALRRAVLEHEKRRHAVEILSSIGDPLHVERKKLERHAPPLVGRDRELSLFTSLLSATREGDRQAVLLVGRERVGKTSILEAWIDQGLARGETPLAWTTSGAALVAGMSGLGQWQERVRRVMQAACDIDAVLALDDLSDLFSERGKSTIDIPSALRPFLEQGRVRLVAEAHEDRVDRMERANAGFFASLARVRVDPLDAKTALDALRARAEWEGRHDRDAAKPTAKALESIVDLAERYLPYESFPGKSARLLSEVRAACTEKTIDDTAVFEAVSLRTGVPTILLREDRALLRDELIDRLTARVIGQPDAVRRVAETVCVVKAGLQPQGKPLATFLFVGPTGIGKTELARALADLLFGAAKGGAKEERLSRFDMSEFMDAYAAERLIRGDDRGEGLLTHQVRKQPFCVLLLDEIEKAHPRVFDLLLQVLGEGRLTDAAGRTAYFHNAIVIMTSNLGAADRRASVGFDRDATSAQWHYERAAQSAFRPEFLNRLDRIVAFRDLGPEHRRKLVQLSLEKVRRRRGLFASGCDLVVSEAALDRLGDEGYSAAHGARALRRHVEETLVSTVARLISAYGDPEGVDVAVNASSESAPPQEVAFEVEGSLRASLVRRGAVKGSHEHAAMREISAVRREIARILHLDRIAELREQVRFLVAQLGYGRKDQAPIEGREQGRLLAEHHRLNELLVAIDRARVDAHSIEETSLEAFLRALPLGEYVEEANRVRSEAVPHLVRALIAQEQQRDRITVIAQELDAGRALDVWLGDLLPVAASRGWSIEAHIDRGARDDRPEWPKELRYGPPRGIDALSQVLRARERTPLAVLLKVTGKDAMLVGLEHGLHRFLGLGGKVDPAHAMIHNVALRTSIGKDEWQKLDPDPNTAFAERIRLPPCRIHHYAEGKVTVQVVGSSLPPVDVEAAPYWVHFDEIALEVLLACEHGAVGREDLLVGRLADDRDEIRAILANEGKIQAIKRYRELTGVGLKEALDAVEAMTDS